MSIKRLFSTPIVRNITSRSTMSKEFQTQIMKVDPDAISFSEFDDGKIALNITDKNTEQALREASRLLHLDEVVAFPTETVYGLGASSLSDDAVLKIFKAKNRPSDNPLISHISKPEMIKDLFGTEIPEIYKPLIKKFWPGPLSIIINNDSPSNKISKFVTAGQSTFSVRLPENKVARALIEISGLPLAAPSANSSTKPSPTLAGHVMHDLNGKIPLILDGGKCSVGLESTVVDGTVFPPMLLRPGGISLEEIQKIGHGWENIILGKKTAGKFEKVRTPGMKYKHYSPTAKVILFENSTDCVKSITQYVENNEELKLEDLNIAIFSTLHWNEYPSNIDVRLNKNLGKTGDEIQRNIFSSLREADDLNIDIIFIEGVSENDEGLAIMNRLSKAASEVIQG